MKYHIFSVLFVLLSGVSLGQVRVSLPQITGNEGDTLVVPVAIDSVSGTNLLSYEFVVSYSQSVVHALSVNSDSTASGASGWTVMKNVSNGSIHVGAFGANPIDSSGVLINLSFVLVGSEGAVSPLAFTTFTLNAGSPTAETMNGSISISGSVPEAPELVNPSTNAVFLSYGSLGFVWLSTGTDNKYRLQIASDSLFTVVVVDDSSLLGTSCSVDSLQAPASYYWRMKSANLVGWSAWSSVREFTLSPCAVSEEAVIPKGMSLSQNYPNPWNPSTTIEYSVPHQMHISLRLYSVLGQFIVQLVDKEVSAGNHRVVLESGQLAAGMYLYQLKGDGISLVRRALLLK